MSILDTDIKLLESERMSDATDGGGRMTSAEIVSGQLSNIFPKVSRTDSVYGRVNLRKVYAAVRSATLDMYGGAHAILTDAPDDPKIGAVLFSTGSAFDTRAAARDRIESYVVAGALSRMRLYGNQIVGAKAITTYQRVEEPLPEAGEVYVLSVEPSGTVTASQYVRITDIEHEVRTFSDQVGDFQRRVLTLKLSSALTQTFQGAEPSRYSNDTSPTKIRGTVVADASKYYGIQPVVGSVAQNALGCTLASVYGSIVPSTNRETAVSMAEVAGAALMRDCAATTTTQSVSFVSSSNGSVIQWAIACGVLPGSFSASYLTEFAVNDDGAGNIVKTSTKEVVGSIHYESGSVSLTSWWSGAGNGTATYNPAVALGQPAHTLSIPVSLATRGSVYTQTLHPLPARGTVLFDYRALGKWYRLRDDGAGVLTADSPSIGTGSVDYTTGAVIATIGALPDIDSAVLFSWGSPTHTVIRAGATADAGMAARQTITLADVPIIADSLSVSYLVNGVQRTLSDNASGVLSGLGATGKVDYVTGRVEIEYSDRLPDFGSSLTIGYNKHVPSGATPVTRSFVTPCETGRLFDLADDQQFAPILPGTLRGTIMMASDQVPDFLLTFTDNGSGGLQTVAYNSGQVGVAGGLSIGTINYNTGVITANQTVTIQYMKWTPPRYREIDVNVGGWGQVPGAASAKLAENGSFVYQTTAGSTLAGVSMGLDPAAPGNGPGVWLCRTTSQPVVPGSVLFALAGKIYFDANGTLYSMSGANRIASGTIDYSTGQCSLSQWNSNTALGLAVHACLAAYGDFTAVETDFRTAGSPLRPASFYVQVTAKDGELLTATANQSGIVTGNQISGSVNQTMGTVHLEFGALVTAAGNENEWWYDAGSVVGGMIWRPREVFPSTLRYNCIVLTNLPLDPTLLGLDPVRLPMDGRVPVYRPGDIVVLHHTDTTALPNPVTPGNSYGLGIANLATLSLADSNGVDVPANLWVANLTTGTVTIDAGANLAPYTQPLVATHRIEQMNLLSDVQVSGLVSWAAATTRAFPAGSLLSSALAFGDLVARVSNVFDQATWTGVWSDSLVGSQASAQYNDINYPIEVLNDGAVTERWRISFTSATAFAVIGENLGQIATGTTSGDVQVVNPLTNKAYFTLRAAGWGTGWATGNQLRFNTIGANVPIWIARTILGGAGLNGDALTLEVRGDTD